MFNYIWPLALVVISNTAYQICTKEVPANMNPLASVTVTYVVAAVVSLILYYALNRGGSIINEYSKLNWAPFVLGLVIVGLEVGFIYAYKAGWSVSTCQVVQGALLAAILIFVGIFLYKEQITWNKIAGVAVCLAGITLINLK